MEQARALGNSRLHDTLDTDSTVASFFWRIYASDLPRTQQTTRILLTSLGETPQQQQAAVLTPNPETGKTPSLTNFLQSHNVRLDARLREIAKGARQGYLKAFSMEQAMEARRQAGDEIVNLPLLESMDEGFARIYEWWRQVIDNAVLQRQQHQQRNNDDTCNTSGSSDNPDNDAPTTVRNVLVVAHAGIFRVFLQRLLGEARLRAHPDARYDPRDGRFAIPNTSLTILEVDVDALPPRDTKEPKDGDAVQVLKLTDARHHTKVEESKTATSKTS